LRVFSRNYGLRATYSNATETGAAPMAPPFGWGNVRTVVAPQEVLSARERDVLQLLARGHTNREVAERLHISVRTAEWHRASIRRKLNITTRAGLVDFAALHGLVQLDA